MQTGQAATGTTLGIQADDISSFRSSRSELVLLRDKGREISAATDQAAWTALKLGEQVPRRQNKFVTFGTGSSPPLSLRRSGSEQGIPGALQPMSGGSRVHPPSN